MRMINKRYYIIWFSIYHHQSRMVFLMWLEQPTIIKTTSADPLGCHHGLWCGTPIALFCSSETKNQLQQQLSSTTVFIHLNLRIIQPVLWWLDWHLDYYHDPGASGILVGLNHICNGGVCHVPPVVSWLRGRRRMVLLMWTWIIPLRRIPFEWPFVQMMKSGNSSKKQRPYDGPRRIPSFGYIRIDTSNKIHHRTMITNNKSCHKRRLRLDWPDSRLSMANLSSSESDQLSQAFMTTYNSLAQEFRTIVSVQLSNLEQVRRVLTCRKHECRCAGWKQPSVAILLQWSIRRLGLWS
jgi:hypothetical protein